MRPPPNSSARSSEQAQLLPGLRRPAKRRGVGRRQRLVESAAPAGSGEPRLELLRIDTLAAHPAAELHVADAAVAALADAAEDAFAPLGKMLVQPAGEQHVNGLGQAQEHPAGAASAGRSRGLQDARDFFVVETG